MTDPSSAVTVAELCEHLEQFDDEAPVAVKASGAYDFLDASGLDDASLRDGKLSVFLNGDRQ